MTEPTSPAIGLSVGTSTLATVTLGCVTSATVTLDRVLSGRPAVTRGGAPIEDFVHRVGDPVGIVAADGSVHSGATLLAEALYEQARTANAGRPLSGDVAVSYPAYWRASTVEALRRALRRIPAWSAGPLMVPDCVAALTALQVDPGLPGRGVVAVCDFGGSGTTITLIDSTNDLQIIGEPLRYPDFSGDLIDRALLVHVLAAAGVTPGSTGTSAIGALTRLRSECGAAKERLSAQTDTTVPGELAGVRGTIRLTRAELDEIVQAPLAGVLVALQDSLQRNGIAPTRLVAVASVGGMAAIPAITATLSEHLRVPVVTIRQPELAAATGAVLCAVRGVSDAGPTMITPMATPSRPDERAEPSAPIPVAWSQAAEVPELVPQLSTRSAPERPAPRPQLEFDQEPAPLASAEPMPWYRKPLTVVAAALAVVASAGGATALALHGDSNAGPTPPSAPGEPAPAASGAPAPSPVIAVPAGTGTVGAPASQTGTVGAPAPRTGTVGAPAVNPPAQRSASAPTPWSQAPAASDPAPESQVTQVSAEAPPPPQQAPSSDAPATDEGTPPPPPIQVPVVPQIPAITPQAPSVPVLPQIPQIPTIPPIPIPSIAGLPTLLPLPQPSH